MKEEDLKSKFIRIASLAISVTKDKEKDLITMEYVEAILEWIKGEVEKGE